MNRQPPNCRQITANAVYSQTANRLYVKGGGGGSFAVATKSKWLSYFVAPVQSDRFQTNRL
jgi:hypothetical protein